MTSPTINVTIQGIERSLELIGSHGLLTYWRDVTTSEVFTYNIDNAQFVHRGTVRDLNQLPPNLRPQ